MKKIITLSCVFLLSVSLVACTSKENKSNTEPKATKTEATTKPTESKQVESNTNKDEVKNNTNNKETNIVLPALTKENTKDNSELKHLTLEEIKNNKVLNEKYQTIAQTIKEKNENRTLFTEDADKKYYIIVANNEKSDKGVKVYNVTKTDNVLMVTFKNTVESKSHVDVVKVDVPIDKDTSIAIHNIGE